MTTFTDTDSLVEDFQTLLTHPQPWPTIALPTNSLSLPTNTLSLPPHILRARSPYFRVLLSARWYSDSGPLLKPNTTADVFQDLLEYLVTGCITLSTDVAAIPHLLALSSLAHETLTTHLERILTRHISSTLDPRTIAAYLRLLSGPLPPVDAALAPALATDPATMLSALPTHPHVCAKLFRLLAHASVPVSDHAPLARFYAACNVSMPQLIQQHPSVRRFLFDFPPHLFARYFEPAGCFTPRELIAMYRRHAIDNPPRQPHPVRLLIESSHPHRRPACLEETVFRVALPDASGYSRLTFDKRSSLPGGAELAFYLNDPALATHPYKFLVGSTFDTTFVLPASEFWFAFASTDCGSDESPVFSCRWGWRFFVEPCQPDIDRLD